MGSIKGQKHNPYLEGRYAHINPNDVVFTPDWLAKQICGMFDIKGKVLEPCKGEGSFLKYLPTNTDWCEIADGKNYYDYNEKVDWIVTNPPLKLKGSTLGWNTQGRFVSYRQIKRAIIGKGMPNIENLLIRDTKRKITKWQTLIKIDLMQKQ